MAKALLSLIILGSLLSSSNALSSAPPRSRRPASARPSRSPLPTVSRSPSGNPTTSSSPSNAPPFFLTVGPTFLSTFSPSSVASSIPSQTPSFHPSAGSTFSPSEIPSSSPSTLPSTIPSAPPSANPISIVFSQSPSISLASSAPTLRPSRPTILPSRRPASTRPTRPANTSNSPNPSRLPTSAPTALPSGGTASSVPSVFPSYPAPSAIPSETPFSYPSSGLISEPTESPSISPSFAPSFSPTPAPSAIPSETPSSSPSSGLISEPTESPSISPSFAPSFLPTPAPSAIPSETPSSSPSSGPTSEPTESPSRSPSFAPSFLPTPAPSAIPSETPSSSPSNATTSEQTESPSISPSFAPSFLPTPAPSAIPSETPSSSLSSGPTSEPTESPSRSPSFVPSFLPTPAPSAIPSETPSSSPSNATTSEQTESPSISPSFAPSFLPTPAPSAIPSETPSSSLSSGPTSEPTESPSRSPSFAPSFLPTSSPSKSAIFSSSFNTLISPFPYWSSAGGDLSNSKHVTSSKISSATLNLSNPSFFMATNLSTTSAPGIYGDYIVFTTTIVGKVFAFSRATGGLIWSKDFFNDYNNIKGVCRHTPVFYNGSSLFIGIWGPSDLLKINLATGALEGKVTLHPHPKSSLLAGGTIYGDRYLIGVASTEEDYSAGASNYTCCTFVGVFVSVNAITMQIEWSWRTIPEAYSGIGMLSGNGIWGSTPPVDPETGLVFFATGNNYNDNANLTDCLARFAQSLWETECHQKIYPENWFDSIIALNITTGAKVWARRTIVRDAWNAGCTISASHPNCPKDFSRDSDFGMVPTLSEYGNKGYKVLYVTLKNGLSFCINASNGATIWTAQTSVSGPRYGIAVDETKVYINVINVAHAQWKLSNNSITLGGGWVAVNKMTGQVVWSTSIPASYDLPPGMLWSNANSNGRARTAGAYGPPVSVNDILLVTSADTVYSPNVGTGIPTYGSGGYVYTLNKTDGSILSSFETGTGIFSGFSADYNCAFVGNGGRYETLGAPRRGKGVYAWCV